MADAVTWITSVLSLQLATIGTVNVTLGMLAAVTLIFGLGVGAFRRMKGR